MGGDSGAVLHLEPGSRELGGAKCASFMTGTKGLTRDNQVRPQ